MGSVLPASCSSQQPGSPIFEETYWGFCQEIIYFENMNPPSPVLVPGIVFFPSEYLLGALSVSSEHIQCPPTPLCCHIYMLNVAFPIYDQSFLGTLSERGGGGDP